MALIKCPDCGKDISDTAKTCVNCGFTIQKWLAQQAAAEKAAQRQAMKRENSAAGENTGKKSLKRWFIIGGASMLVIAAIVVSLLVFVSRPAVPTFGLKAGMTLDEIAEVMERQGFKTFDDSHDGYRQFTGQANVLGFQPSVIVVSNTIMEFPIMIRFAFLDPDCRERESVENARILYDDLGSLEEKLYQQALLQLGEATEYEDGHFTHEYSWTQEPYRYALEDCREDHWIVFWVGMY